MEVQWQLVDIKTKETIAMLGEPFIFLPSVFREKLERNYKILVPGPDYSKIILKE